MGLRESNMYSRQIGQLSRVPLAMHLCGPGDVLRHVAVAASRMNHRQRGPIRPAQRAARSAHLTHALQVAQCMYSPGRPTRQMPQSWQW